MDLSDPYIRLVVETLVKTITSKTIELGISGISKLLSTALKEGRTDEAEKLIKSNPEEIGVPAAQIASQALSASLVVPILSERTANAEDLLTLFRQVIELGFSISKHLDADICLPGTMLGTKSAFCFTTNRKEISLSKMDRTLLVHFQAKCDVGIVPSSDPVELCAATLNKIRERREVTTAYVSVLPSLYTQGYSLESLNVQSVKYRNISGMSKDKQKDLELSGDRAAVKDWYEGIQMLIKFAKGISTIDVLPEAEGAQVFELLKRLSEIYKSDERKEIVSN